MILQFMTTRNFFVTVVALVVGAVGSWYYFSVQPEPIPVVKKSILTVPRDANSKDISKCSFEMGTHYTRPEDTKDKTYPFTGPTYSYWAPTGEVISIEYHISEEALKTMEPPFALNPLRDPIKSERSGRGTFAIDTQKWDLFGAAYESVDLRWQDEGHSGYETPHYDIHVYTKTTEELETYQCGEASKYREEDLGRIITP